ncbi:MAG: glycosyltransferase [Marmoricola sp.]|nr:glycosyltransferase [Marmoricola sp.]
MSTVHVVLPGDIDDPARPSGGNTYDRRVCQGLTGLGWSVHERAVAGAWPSPDPAARVGLREELARVPDGEVVLIDGLVASSVPEALGPQAGRLRLVVLVHMPLGDEQADADTVARECAALSAAAAVVTTSEWTRGWLLERYPLRPDDVHVAAPGVDAADLAPGTAAGGELLCVAAVTAGKGHDVLLDALADVADLPWRLVCVGTLTRDPTFVEILVRRAVDLGIRGRVTFTGPRTGRELDDAYAAADALVLATRVESYGMVVAEALAHGLPVVATSIGGLPEALGHLRDGSRPGLLVPSGDAHALAAALRCWLSEPVQRQRFRIAARERRTGQSRWPETADRVSRVLAGVTQ